MVSKYSDSHTTAPVWAVEDGRGGKSLRRLGDRVGPFMETERGSGTMMPTPLEWLILDQT